jgi:hypothetical protein
MICRIREARYRPDSEASVGLNREHTWRSQALSSVALRNRSPTIMVPSQKHDRHSFKIFNYSLAVAKRERISYQLDFCSVLKTWLPSDIINGTVLGKMAHYSLETVCGSECVNTALCEIRLCENLRYRCSRSVQLSDGSSMVPRNIGSHLSDETLS